MSLEEHSVKVKPNMDNYMRAKCDAFLQSLAQISHMINSVKSEMYAEISDAASTIVFQSPVCNEGYVTCAESSSDTDNDSFSLPKQQRKRIKRRESRDQKSTVETPSQAPVPGFSGKVPDAFIYGCTKDTRSEVIKEHLV